MKYVVVSESGWAMGGTLKVAMKNARNPKVYLVYLCPNSVRVVNFTGMLCSFTWRSGDTPPRMVSAKGPMDLVNRAIQLEEGEFDAEEAAAAERRRSVAACIQYMPLDVATELRMEFGIEDEPVKPLEEQLDESSLARKNEASWDSIPDNGNRDGSEKLKSKSKSKRK